MPGIAKLDLTSGGIAKPNGAWQLFAIGDSGSLAYGTTQLDSWELKIAAKVKKKR